MRHFLLTVIGTIVGIIIFLILTFIFLMVFVLSGGKESKPDQIVLSLDLRGGVIDHAAGSSLFGSSPINVVDIVQGLQAAKTDDDVKGLYIHVSPMGMAPASAEEIRLAIKDFTSSGKFAVAHAQGFEGTSILGYHAVSSASEIWQQDTTGFAVSGLRSEMPFYGGVADKFDAQVQMEQFYEYKNAANVYTQTDFTEAHREATTSLLTSLYDNAVSQIAIDRDLSEAKLRSIFESSPHSAEAALEAGLIDRLGHRIEAVEYVKEKAGGEDTEMQSVTNYAKNRSQSGPVIALIGGQGPVVMGQSSNGGTPFMSEITMGGDTVSAAFERAIKDKRVKAIIFRVSTPGGSPTASDQIQNATLRAKEAGKPVIVSMGQYAASGGYYVSTHADKIVAMPSTITGSIGVLGGKIALRDTYAKIGYNVEAIDVGGEYVGAYSGDEPFTQSQRAAYRGQLEDIYKDFTQRVADGRGIPIETVLEIAKGRVWTGEQAIGHGLVDELGGLRTAIKLAKAEANIDAAETVRLVPFPRPKSQQEQIAELLDQMVQVQSDIAAMREIMASDEIQALLDAKARIDQNRELEAVLPKIQ
ncbi:MAG: signal peptide peptidase SppA [Hellea sp.]|nr:signal peptide peptidase SppA [Hellea sp.]